MRPNDMLTIGQLSQAAGLSTDTLRRYGVEGLLPPAFVDPRTRYRRYQDKQVSAARLIRYLRKAGVPVSALKRILQKDGNALSMLHEHRARLVEEYNALRHRVEMIDRLVNRPAMLIDETDLDEDSVDIIGPNYWLMADGEVWLETTHMTPAEMTYAEDHICGLYNVRLIELTTEPEFHSRWTIFTITPT